MVILDETEIYAPKRYPGYLWAFKLELAEYKLSSPDTCGYSSFWPPSDLLLQLSCTACCCACSLGWPEGWKEDAKIAYTSGNSICQNAEMGGWQTGLCSLISNNCLSLKEKRPCSCEWFTGSEVPLLYDRRKPLCCLLMFFNRHGWTGYICAAMVCFPQLAAEGEVAVSLEPSPRSGKKAWRAAVERRLILTLAFPYQS